MQRPPKRVWFANQRFPKCFDSHKQFEDWEQAMYQAKVPIYTCWVCTDCLPSYQQKMIAAGRCENPHVKFRKEYESHKDGSIRDSEWFIVGYVPDDVYQAEKERRIAEQSAFWQQLKALKIVV